MPFGRKSIEYLRFDQRTENLNRDLKDFCKQTEVVQQLTAPHTPQQNRMSDRADETVTTTRYFEAEVGLFKLYKAILWA